MLNLVEASRTLVSLTDLKIKPKLLFQITCTCDVGFNKQCMHMLPCLLQGKLKYNEVVYDGFESMYDAFASLFKGTHIGKVVVKV